MGGHDDAQHPSVSQFDVRAIVPNSDDSVEVANTMEDNSDGERPSMKFLRSMLSPRLQG